MRVILQRVSCASVKVAGNIVGSIGRGFLLLVGFTHDDKETDLIWTARKIGSLRLFEDAEGKMNLPLSNVEGQILAVSQFTLYADVRKGRRPAFIDAARPEQAEQLFNRFIDLLKNEGFVVRSGLFGAKMEVELINDGPVTLIIESQNIGS
ncbi:MAG: D-tyrosyl-tRNA(Tyr) deacylase [Calditrichaeota bacterium]|nr:D-tyrosyl-tRNA(Tyr) deacylase [Calditrichota bacterium]